jgi:hypothetical protein
VASSLFTHRSASATQALGLQSDFPDVERRYKIRSLEKLVAKGLWNVAIMFAGDDKELMVHPRRCGCLAKSATQLSIRR